jgi:hypothetical protein
VVALDAAIALSLVGVLELALAAQGQGVALELGVDVVGIDLGQPWIGAGEVIDRARPSRLGNVTTVKGSSTGVRQVVDLAQGDPREMPGAAGPCHYRQSARIGTGVERVAAIYNRETLSPISRSRGT